MWKNGHGNDQYQNQDVKQQNTRYRDIKYLNCVGSEEYNNGSTNF